ncbi:MAG TPA: hypothetical protein VKA67_05215 [Verrucomicrobiae bacterium]|nr:hypothetical protein [Verrucomicrobiae bacterium]
MGVFRKSAVYAEVPSGSVLPPDNRYGDLFLLTPGDVLHVWDWADGGYWVNRSAVPPSLTSAFKLDEWDVSDKASMAQLASGEVTAFNSQVTGGVSLITSAGAGFYPILGADASGRPELLFDGTNDLQNASYPTVAQPLTIYMCHTPYDWQANHDVLYWNTAPKTRLYKSATPGVMIINAGTPVALDPIPVGAPSVFALVLNGAASAFKLGLNAPVAFDAGPNGFTTAMSVLMNNFAGLHHLAHYGAGHSDAEMIANIKAMQSKWGV